MDWLVIGGGLTGVAIAYELQRQGSQVHLVDPQLPETAATRFSYGGAPFWAATSPAIADVFTEGRRIYAELSAVTGLTLCSDRQILLTCSEDDQIAIAQSLFANLAQPPQLLDRAEAIAHEPLLADGDTVAAFVSPHPIYDPETVVLAYRQAFLAIGGQISCDRIEAIQPQVQGSQRTYTADRLVIAAGASSIAWARSLGYRWPLYFSHAEILETPPLDLRLRAIVMPALQQRFSLERQADQWDWDSPEVPAEFASILDAGAVQLSDRRYRLGQISRLATRPGDYCSATESEQQIRMALASVLPAVSVLPATRHHCCVSFSADGLPVAGRTLDHPQVYWFTGFSGPFAWVPGLARHLASVWSQSLTLDSLACQVSPQRWSMV
ncbi:FAD-dependent oxidoreductase [Synechococcus elongatus IITB7]|uniref:NAD(P)/FAD-dependent oxidoreductase n=1 Tax=Synechococcus elongatus TaxID=32046 RepID=UPI0030D254D3